MRTGQIVAKVMLYGPIGGQLQKFKKKRPRWFDKNSGKHSTWRWSQNDSLPQGDSINGIFFNIYLEDILQRARCEFNLKKPEVEHPYSETEKSSRPKEIVYTNDADFIFETKE